MGGGTVPLITESFQGDHNLSLSLILYLINCRDKHQKVASWHWEGIVFLPECGVRCKAGTKQASAFQKAELFSVSETAKKSLQDLLQSPELWMLLKGMTQYTKTEDLESETDTALDLQEKKAY